MKSGIRSGWAALGVAAALLSSAPAWAEPSPKNVTRQIQNEVNVALPSLSPIVERVMAAVVNVSVIMGPPGAAAPIADRVPPASSEEQALNDMLRHFFEQYGHRPQPGGQGETEEQTIALGSGFIIDPSGYIVTNNHVVANAERVTVILQDNTRHKARVVGRDPKTDLALLKIDATKPLPYVQWGDSDAAKVGDWVVAVGNPFGLGGTVTAGIISARGRNIDEGPYDNFLQIDAPINRGNSGGPTFNLHGEVIGINTAIFSPSGGSVGIGFAIPSNFAKIVIAQLKATGHVERGWLGVSIQSMTPAIAKAFDIDPKKPNGALVDSVVPGSPAAKAGLQRGDVIAGVDGKPVRSVHDLPRLVALTRIGATLTLTIDRDGAAMTKKIQVAPMPSAAHLAAMSGATAPAAKPARIGPLGLQLGNLTPELRARLHADGKTKGVVVEGMVAGGPGASLGLKPGDIIESVNRQAVDKPKEAEAKIASAVGSGTVLLFVERGGNGEFVGMTATH